MRDPIRERRRVQTLVAILAGVIVVSLAIRMISNPVLESVPPAHPVRQDFAWIERSSMRGLLPADLHYGGSRWGSGRLLLLGHRVGPGERTVLAWRAYYDDPRSTDDEGFEFLTIELDGPVSGRTFTFPSATARAFYSRGSSSWGLGEYSGAVTGEVQVGHLNPRMTTPVVVRLDIRPVNPHTGMEIHDVIRLEKRMTMSRHPVEDLFPWLSGTSPTPQGKDRTVE
ncbi:MAG TPA: hypothetical protein VFS19_06260 [Planctomycetota bacterium]|nr:hypothetical protein [Planctomycetota bacterium]